MVALASKSTWINMGIVLLGYGCQVGELSPPVQFSKPQAEMVANTTLSNPPKQQETALLQEVDRVGETCRNSHGIWQPLLVSCHCPAHTIFVVERGCVAPMSPELDGLIALQTSMNSYIKQHHGCKQINFQKSLSIEQLFNPTDPVGFTEMPIFSSGFHHIEMMLHPQDFIEHWFHHVNCDATRLLADAAITLRPKPQSTIEQRVLLGAILDTGPWLWLGMADAFVLETFTTTGVIALRNPSSEQEAAPVDVTQCTYKISKALGANPNVFLDHPAKLTPRKICKNLALAIQALNNPSEEIMQHRHIRGLMPHCLGSCTLGVELQVGEHLYSLDVFLSGFVGLQRRLLLHLNDKNKIEIALSSSGKIMYSMWQWAERASPNERCAYFHKELNFDENFNLIDRRASCIGNNHKLRSNVANTLQKMPTNLLLPIDRLKHLSDVPIGAAVMEVGFSLGEPAFNRRLAFDMNAAYALVEQAVAIDLFTGETSSMPNYYINNYINYKDHATKNIEGLSMEQLTEADEDISFEALHGHEVASIMMNDLINIRIDLISAAQYHSSDESPAIKAQKLCQRLRRNHVRVLNLSYGFDEHHASCAKFFQILASSCHEILLVTAAGNLDAELFGANCPAGMDPTLENFITVSGVNKSFHQINQVNYSQSMVTIAALSTGVPTLSPNLSLHPSDGTSFAAPQIANAALHLFARRPELSPKQAIALLKKHCFKDNLPVICGGALNVDEFFSEEIDPYSNQLPPQAP